MHSMSTSRLITYLRIIARDPFEKIIKGDISESVECPKNSLLIAFAGQSNNANSVKRVKTASSFTNAYMFDYSSRRCFAFSEPVLGTEGTAGHVATDTINELRQLGERRPIIVIAFSKGGSSIIHWANGALKKRTSSVSDAINDQGMTLDYLIWHQGESDAIPQGGFLTHYHLNGKNSVKDFRPVRRWYKDYLDKYISFSSKKFPDANILIAQASYCLGDDSKGIRDSQIQVAKENKNAKVSINTDSLVGKKYRYDDCHFNESASKIIGSWYANEIITISAKK